jgi:hypothetical protein
MVENDLELGKKLFKLFPELERCLGHFILLEDIDKYVYYGFVDKEREKGIEIITCEITIFTITSIFSFTIRKPDELMQTIVLVFNDLQIIKLIKNSTWCNLINVQFKTNLM